MMTFDFSKAVNRANSVTNPPPTEKQIEYAKRLSERVGFDLPKEFTKEAYNRFIAKCINEEIRNIILANNWSFDDSYWESLYMDATYSYEIEFWND